MKLIRAEFENFRLLRDLVLDFSTDPTKKLTVIRAENATGKTTILNALQWGFYGDIALPKDGVDYRISPLDWDPAYTGRIPISVKIEFEIERNSSEDPERFIVIRTAYETLEGTKFNRDPSKIELLQRNNSGWEPIEYPEGLVHDSLPIELREVFFTDGDRALSFIQAAVNIQSQRKRVEEAIRSLLGLGIIENAINHVKKTNSNLNQEAKKIGSDSELTEISTKIEQIDNDISTIQEKLEDANLQFAEYDKHCSEISRKIEALLIQGDREKLNQELNQVKSQLEKIDNQLTAASKSHSELFRSESLVRDLLAPFLEKSLDMLNELRDQGKLPITTIPILEERLNDKTCICGESLDPLCTDAQHRRKYIETLIEDSRKSDAQQNSLTNLYFSSQTLHPKKINDEDYWVNRYKKVKGQRLELDDIRSEVGKKHKSFEVQLDNIPDTDIQGLRVTLHEHLSQRDRYNVARTQYTEQLKKLTKDRKSLVSTRNNLRRKQRTGAHILVRQEGTDDIVSILQNSYNRITNEELTSVSVLMNNLFLEMIGEGQGSDQPLNVEKTDEDLEQESIIRGTKINQDFDILVYGANNVPINPDYDLNGASRRALTLAFILALTKVSEVEAPNVIDTPLGMMSGYVKRSVLRTAIRESSQLILFLTRSEIKDCEDIIDEEAGRVITLTNPAHYDKMLVNEPPVSGFKIIMCDCKDLRDCPICMRKTDSELETVVEP